MATFKRLKFILAAKPGVMEVMAVFLRNFYFEFCCYKNAIFMIGMNHPVYVACRWLNHYQIVQISKIWTKNSSLSTECHL
jgi:hypothetical protein